MTALHSYVSTNGDVTKEVSGQYVIDIHRCVVVADDLFSPPIHYRVCGMYLSHAGQGITSCVRGDSGGPVYHRLGGALAGDVNASGLVIAGYDDDPQDCWFEGIFHILHNGGLILNI
jgi:hypothetical protein